MESLTITRFSDSAVKTILDYPRTRFSLKGSEIQTLSNIDPRGKRTATYKLTPKACIHNEKIDATVFYKDHTGSSQNVPMRPKEVHCVCPYLKEKPMREGEFAQLVDASERIQEGLLFMELVSVKSPGSSRNPVHTGFMLSANMRWMPQK